MRAQPSATQKPALAGFFSSIGQAHAMLQTGKHLITKPSVCWQPHTSGNRFRR